MPDLGAIIRSATGLDSAPSISLSLAPQSIQGPINGAGLGRVQVTLTNRSSTAVEFIQTMTLFRIEGGHISDVICEFGSTVSEVEPRLCDIDQTSWFPLAPGKSVGNASAVPFFLPFVGIYLEPGQYVVAAPIMDSNERLWLATATLDVTN